MDMTEGRCEALLRLRRHFNELLFDQVCVATWGLGTQSFAGGGKPCKCGLRCHPRAPLQRAVPHPHLPNPGCSPLSSSVLLPLCSCPC